MNKITEICRSLSKHGFGGHFGSKSGYRESNPKADPIFNAYILAKDDYGLLQKLQPTGDIEITSEKDLEKLKQVSIETKSDLFVYHESTVHNVTFNGGVFPYEQWRVKVSYSWPDQSAEVIIKDR